MCTIVILTVAGFWFWKRRKRRKQRFVRAVCFLDSLDRGVNVNEANGIVARLFTKRSTPQDNAGAIAFANDKAQRLTKGKKRFWIKTAQEKGFVIDCGSIRTGMAKTDKSAVLGKQVGPTVRNMITTPFTIAHAPIPERVFIDPYVAGFTTRFIQFWGVSLGSLQFTPEQLTNYYKTSILNMVGPQLFDEFVAMPQDGQSYLQGVQHGALYYGAMFMPGELDSSDAQVSEAIELAKSRVGMMGAINEITGAGDGTKQDAEHAALIWAIKSMTLENHLRNKYGIDV